MLWFDVFLDEDLVDEVPYQDHPANTEDSVKKDLVEHDGYDPNIVVCLAQD